ncbi:MAG: DUF302 domain-containing protein [Chitinophaga sp.]|uniref:DUF302 domain-containing protein n=1 Tax=Chitinophaga sp. TaxID=1869181 RepID=UPI001B0CF417|nr:DUF302 domain-containing protein [Chitinophaga sp.]MBO9732563.1 DUF302 domain-containing protein [Chitinophaga sp.]
MKTDNITLLLEQPFEAALSQARTAIAENGFLLLHEINPQAILASQQIEIGPVRQLLFFHPVYMKQLLDRDPTAVIEVPLKLVLRATDKGTTLSYFNPVAHFEGYEGLDALGKELHLKVELIVAQLRKTV